MRRKKLGSKRTGKGRRLSGPPVLEIPVYGDSRITVERFGGGGPTREVEIKTVGSGGSGGSYCSAANVSPLQSHEDPVHEPEDRIRVTKARIEEYINAAELELGPACEDPWAKEIASYLRRFPKVFSGKCQ